MAGSIRQRGVESWELRVHTGRDAETGKKRYATKTVRGSRRAAELELARLLTQVDDGAIVVTAGTVGELCEKWFLHAEPSLSPAVAAEYRRLLDRRILPKWGLTPLRRLRTADLDVWYSHLRKAGAVDGGPLAPNSVVHTHAILRRALNQGVTWGWLASNPASNATPPRVRRRPIEVPTAAEVGDLMVAAADVNPALPMFIRLAATTGARRGELCALRWSRVDVDQRRVHIARSLAQVGRAVIEKGTKTHAERRFALDPGTAEMLSVYHQQRRAVLAGIDGVLSDDAFVFSHSPTGVTPWRPDYVTLAFGRVARRLGIKSIHLHSLRHFAATTMLVNGVDVRTAAGRLGHAQTSMTLDTYAHFVSTADDAAAATLGQALDGSHAADKQGRSGR